MLPSLAINTEGTAAKVIKETVSHKRLELFPLFTKKKGRHSSIGLDTLRSGIEQPNSTMEESFNGTL